MINKTYPIAQKLIKQALEHTEQLHALLQEEAFLLKETKNPLMLSKNTQQKNEVIGWLNTFAKQIEQLLNSEEIDKDSGMSQYFSIAQQAGIEIETALNDWQQLTERAAQCQHLNEQNGASIYILNQHSQRALDILKGKSQTINTYGRNGYAKSNRHSSTLISV